MIKLIGISLVSTSLYSVVKKYCPEYAILAEIGGVLLVLFFAYPYIKNVIDFYYEYTEFGGMSNNYIRIVIKTIGIAVLTQFSSDICRDSGQTALAGKIEFAGKLIMAVLALPIAQSLIEVAVSVIEAE